MIGFVIGLIMGVFIMALFSANKGGGELDDT